SAHATGRRSRGPGRRDWGAVAAHQEDGDGRQGDLQPGQPRFSDVSARELSALQERRGAQPGIREAQGAQEALSRPREALNAITGVPKIWGSAAISPLHRVFSP